MTLTKWINYLKNLNAHDLEVACNTSEELEKLITTSPELASSAIAIADNIWMIVDELESHKPDVEEDHKCTCGGNCHHEEVLCPKCIHAYKRVMWMEQEAYDREYLNIPYNRVCEQWAFPARKCPDFEPISEVEQ